MKWFDKLFRKNTSSRIELGSTDCINSMVQYLTNQAQESLPRIEKSLGSKSFQVRGLKNVINKGNLFLSPSTPEESKGKILASLTESIRKSGMSWH